MILGTVIFPSGHTFLTTQFQIVSSNTAMLVEEGAVVLGSSDTKEWKTNIDFISASNLNNVVVYGNGTVNGQGLSGNYCVK